MTESNTTNLSWIQCIFCEGSRTLKCVVVHFWQVSNAFQLKNLNTPNNIFARLPSLHVCVNTLIRYLCDSRFSLKPSAQQTQLSATHFPFGLKEGEYPWKYFSPIWKLISHASSLWTKLLGYKTPSFCAKLFSNYDGTGGQTKYTHKSVPISRIDKYYWLVIYIVAQHLSFYYKKDADCKVLTPLNPLSEAGGNWKLVQLVWNEPPWLISKHIARQKADKQG